MKSKKVENNPDDLYQNSNDYSQENNMRASFYYKGKEKNYNINQQVGGSIVVQKNMKETFGLGDPNTNPNSNKNYNNQPNHKNPNNINAVNK